MAVQNLVHVLRQLRQLVRDPAVGDLADGELLDRFRRGEEAAFALLVQRHGASVLGVCRRLLGNAHEAEDAFQATFLVLVRKASSIRKRSSIGSWLYGVAYRVATKARARATRRRTSERLSAAMPRAEPSADLSWPELRSVLDEELARLPEKYRAAVVLCHLEGKTQQQAARELGCPKSSLGSRLIRARQLLRRRLAARGIGLSAGLMAALAGESAVAVPARLVLATVRLAALVAAGKSAAAGATAKEALGLAGDVARGMAAARLTVVAGAVVILAGLGAAAGMLAHPAGSEAPQSPPDKAPAVGLEQNPALGKLARTDRFGDPLPAGAVARLGTTRFRHVGAAALALTTDGKAVVTCGGDDRVVRVWDTDTGRLLRERPIAREGWPLALSADGRRLALSHFDQGTLSITLWDLERDQLVCMLPVEKSRRGLRQGLFSPDGKTLVTAEVDGTLRAYDMDTGKGWLVGNHESQARSLAFTADGTLVSSARDPKARNGNCLLRFWDVAGGRERARLALPQNTFEAFVSPDGRTIAVCVADRYVKGVQFVDAATGTPADGYVGPSVEKVTGVQFAPDGKTIAVSTADGTLIWDPAAGKQVRALPGGDGCRLTYSPDGKSLAALRGWGDHSRPRTTAVLVWDVATGAARAGAEQGHLDEVAGVALAPDGRTAATVSYEPYSGPGTIRLWDIATGRTVWSLRVNGLINRPLAFGRDGKHLFVGDGDGITRLEVATGREAGRYPAAVWFLHLTDDGQTLWGGRHHGTGPAGGIGGGGGGGGMGPGGGGVTMELHAWDVVTGKPLPAATFSVTGPGSMWAGYSRFSPDGRLLAVPGGVIFETATGRELGRLTIEGQSFGTASAFSPDGSLLAAGEERRGRGEPRKATVHVWEVATLLPVARLETGEVAHLAFTPDGRRLVAAGLEALQLWDIASGKELVRRPAPGRFRGHFGPSFASSFALGADGRTAVTGHLDTAALLWDLTPPKAAPAPLTAADREACWADLAAADAGRAFAAMNRLADQPGQALPLLRERLRPARAPAEQELRRLLADLDAAQFATREAAGRQLAELGDSAAAALRDAMRRQPSPEARRRIEALLAGLPVVRDPESRRHLRAARVLDRIGTPEARDVLKVLAGGVPEARLTQQAQASLERLARRRNLPP
jgi:RNA polymerase sigma factor (sigma-70 family)